MSRMVGTKTVRYGTALCPYLRRRVPAAFPSALLRPVKPSTERPHCFADFRCTGPPTARLTPIEPSRSLIPLSVSFILQCTSDLELLYHWQMRMMREMGEAKFRSFLKKRMETGTDFHAVVREALEELRRSGTIPTMDDDYVRKLKEAGIIKHSDEIAPFIRTVQPVIERVKFTPTMRIEEKIYDSHLFYAGRVDAIVDFNGVPTLVDWKTIYAGSAKSTSEKDLLVEDLYSDPVQVAAYIGAINSDPKFADLPKIKQGALVCTFEDGREPCVVVLNEEELEAQYQEFLRRLNAFWWRMENADAISTDDGPTTLVDFVYNPAVPDSKKNNSKSPPKGEEPPGEEGGQSKGADATVTRKDGVAVGAGAG